MKTLLLTSSLLSIAFAATFPSTATANDKLDYDYVDLGYVHSAGERTSDKVGYKLGISLSMSESWYLRGGYQSQSADVWAADNKGDVSAKEYSLALGWHAPMNRTNDIFLEAGYVRFDGDSIIPQSTYGNDEDGFLANIGFRGRLSTNWEYSLFAGYKDYDYSSYVDETLHEDSKSTSYGIETRYYLSKNWSFGISASEQITGLTSGFDFRYNL